MTGKMQGKAEWEAMVGGQYWNAPERRSVSSLPISGRGAGDTVPHVAGKMR